MAKRFFTVTVLIAACVNGYAADDAAVFARYQDIVQSETNAPAAMRKGKQYLASLSRDDFIAFIRETGRHAEYARDNADSVSVMAIFAKCYKEGPGRDEPLLLTLKQLSDATLPASWRMGLLDVLRLDNRSDLSDEEVAAVTSVLDEMGQSKQVSDVFRSVCLQKLGGFLYTQRELIVQKAPDLKGAIEKQDRASLPTRDDADVKRAGKLIDAIRDYKAALQKAAEEVRDEQIKASLKTRLTKWESSTLP